MGLTERPSKDERFALTDYFIGDKNSIELTFEQYNELLAARDLLLHTLQMDEKFFAASEHYRELEEYGFGVSLENLLYLRTDARAFYTVGFQFGRRLSALLTAVGLYTDSIVSHGRAITSGSVTDKEFKKLTSIEYDKSFDYRVMETLRNYVKHQGYPVHSTTFKHNRPKEDRDRMEFSTSFYFNISYVEGQRFKASVRKEIEELGGKLELKECVRSYFSSICDIHTNFRELVKRHKEEAEAAKRKWQNVWSTTFPGEDLEGVAACKFNGRSLDEKAEKAYLRIQFDEYREWLEARTRILVNMRHRRAIVY